MEVLWYALRVDFLLLKLFFFIFDNEPESADFCDPISMANFDQLRLVNELSKKVPVAQDL